MIRRLNAFVRNIVRKERLDDDLDQEIRGYLELVSAEKALSGMSAEDAARAARRELGSIEQVKENVRDIRIGGSMDALVQDLRYAARILRKNARFTVAAVLTLAVGIGRTRPSSASSTLYCFACCLLHWARRAFVKSWVWLPNIKHEALDAPTEPALYMPYMQDETNHFLGSFNLFVRAQKPLYVAEPVRALVHRLKPEQPVAYMQTMTDYLVSTLAPRRFSLLLFNAFAFLALLLATIGIYGVVAYSVSRRTREFGLRIALGATHADVLRTVIREGFALAWIGIAIGIAAAFPVLNLMRSLTFGVGPLDPLTYTAVAFLLLTVTILACAIPARKASLVDPMRAIGSE